MRGKKGSRRSTSESQTSTYEHRQPPSSANNPYRSRRREQETLAVAQAPRPRAPRRANFDELPNPDIGNQQPELSTTFAYLPDATGIHFNAAYFFYCRSTNILGDPSVHQTGANSRILASLMKEDPQASNNGYMTMYLFPYLNDGLILQTSLYQHISINETGYLRELYFLHKIIALAMKKLDFMTW